MADLRFKFYLPDSDVELDIRDYHLRHAGGMYLLLRNEEPKEEARFNDWLGEVEFRPKFHFAHFILLEGCTAEQAEQMLEMYPSLRNRP